MFLHIIKNNLVFYFIYINQIASLLAHLPKLFNYITKIAKLSEKEKKKCLIVELCFILSNFFINWKIAIKKYDIKSFLCV